MSAASVRFATRCQQRRRSRAPIAIERGVGHVVQIQRRGVAEQQALQNRLQQEHVTGARIFQDRQQLFADQSHHAKQRGEHGGSAQ